jgi:Protein of unknown function (DUF2800)
MISFIHLLDDRLGLPSASEMHRNKECSGNRIFTLSLREKGFLRSEKLTPEAKLGDRIHASLEGDPEELERKAKEIRESCHHLASRAARQFFRQQQTTITYEHRLWYQIAGTPFFSGRPDRVYAHPSRLLDVNFKTGRGDEDEAALNYQLRTEVVLLDDAYPSVDEIGVAIIQPLVTHSPEIAIYDREARHAALLEILDIVDQTFWTETRRPGSHCRFCPARAFCPEAREYSVKWPIQVNVDALPIGQDGAEMLARVKIAKGLLNSMEEAFKEIVQENPKAIPGWWISKGKDMRAINSWRKAIEIIEGLAGEMEEAGRSEKILRALDMLTIPIGKLEAFAHNELELNSRTFEKLFESVISHKQSQGTLEPIPKRLRG